MFFVVLVSKFFFKVNKKFRNVSNKKTFLEKIIENNAYLCQYTLQEKY